MRSFSQNLNYGITWFYFGATINNFSRVVHQGVSYISGCISFSLWNFAARSNSGFQRGTSAVSAYGLEK